MEDRHPPAVHSADHHFLELSSSDQSKGSEKEVLGLEHRYLLDPCQAQSRHYQTTVDLSAYYQYTDNVQALFRRFSKTRKNAVYHPSMAGRLKRPRPKQGERLLRLRQAAGLTQEELAELIGESQSNIAFWEQSDKPPRSDILPKMAEALGVGVESLLDGNSRPERKGGPTGKVHKVFEEVSQLPRRQQEKIIEFVSAFVNQYKQSKE